MIEKFRELLCQFGAYGATLTDLPNAFKCLHHELHKTKLRAYGLDISSLKLIHS